MAPQSRSSPVIDSAMVADGVEANCGIDTEAEFAATETGTIAMAEDNDDDGEADAPRNSDEPAVAELTIDDLPILDRIESGGHASQCRNNNSRSLNNSAGGAGGIALSPKEPAAKMLADRLSMRAMMAVGTAAGSSTTAEEGSSTISKAELKPARPPLPSPPLSGRARGRRRSANDDAERLKGKSRQFHEVPADDGGDVDHRRDDRLRGPRSDKLGCGLEHRQKSGESREISEKARENCENVRNVPSKQLLLLRGENAGNDNTILAGTASGHSFDPVRLRRGRENGLAGKGRIDVDDDHEEDSDDEYDSEDDDSDDSSSDGVAEINASAADSIKQDDDDASSAGDLSYDDDSESLGAALEIVSRMSMMDAMSPPLSEPEGDQDDAEVDTEAASSRRGLLHQSSSRRFSHPVVTTAATTAAAAAAPFLAPIPVHSAAEPPNLSYSIGTAAAAAPSSPHDNHNSEDFSSQIVELKLALANARSKIDEQDLMLRHSRRDAARMEYAVREAEELRTAKANLERELSKLKLESVEGEAEISALTSASEKLVEERDELRRRLVEAERGEDRRRRVMDHLMEEAAMSARRRSELMEKLAGQAVRTQEVRSDLLAAERQAEEDRKQISKLEEEKAALEGTLARCTEDGEQLQSSLLEATNELDQLRRETVCLQKSNADLSRRLDRAELRLERAQEGGSANAAAAGLGMFIQNAGACLGATVGMRSSDSSARNVARGSVQTRTAAQKAAAASTVTKEEVAKDIGSGAAVARRWGQPWGTSSLKREQTQRMDVNFDDDIDSDDEEEEQEKIEHMSIEVGEDVEDEEEKKIEDVRKGEYKCNSHREESMMQLPASDEQSDASSFVPNSDNTAATYSPTHLNESLTQPPSFEEHPNASTFGQDTKDKAMGYGPNIRAKSAKLKESITYPPAAEEMPDSNTLRHENDIKSAINDTSSSINGSGRWNGKTHRKESLSHPPASEEMPVSNRSGRECQSNASYRTNGSAVNRKESLTHPPASKEMPNSNISGQEYQSTASYRTNGSVVNRKESLTHPPASEEMPDSNSSDLESSSDAVRYAAKTNRKESLSHPPASDEMPDANIFHRQDGTTNTARYSHDISGSVNGSDSWDDSVDAKPAAKPRPVATGWACRNQAA